MTKASLFTQDNGYTEVTSLPTDAAELAKYYYVIADASEEKMLQLADAEVGLNGESGKDYKAMKYVDVNDPLQNQGDLWIIEHTTEGYHIRSMAYSGLLMQLEYNAAKYRRTHDQPHACTWTKLNFTYTTDKGWQIESGTYTGNYFGYWDRANNQNEISSGKQGSDIGNYKIYQIKRATYFENYYKNAEKDDDGGVDVTNLIVNPQLKTVMAQYKGQIEGYTITYTGPHAAPASNVDKCEFWNKNAANLTFDISQTVNLPNGKYSLTGTMFCSGYSGGTVGVFAQNEYTPITEDSQTAKDYTVENVAVTDETLTFGYKTVNNPVVGWFVGKGFKLTYYGEDISAYVEALNTAIAKAEAITPSANAAANNALTAAIEKAKAVDQTNKDDILVGTSELNNAIATYNAAVAAYPSYQDMEKYAEDMFAAMTVVEDADKTAFTNVIAAQKTAMEETATDAASIKACEDALVAACKEYVGKANPAADQIFDITRLYLVNPDLTGFVSGSHPEGWYTDISCDGGKQAMRNAEVKGDTDKDYFYEIYNGKGTLATGKGIYQKATLPAGTYKMEAYGFSRAANNVSGTGDGYISAFANETLGAPALANTMTEISTAFTLDAESEAKMGMYVADGNKGNWAGCGYMKLYKYNTDALAVAKAAYEEAKNAAEAVKDSKMSKEVSEALVAAINATPEENAEAYNTAAATLVSATNAANASIISYAALKTALDKYPVRSEFSGVEFTAREAADAAYEKGSYTNEEANTKASELLDEYRQYLRDIVKNYKTATAFVTTATCDKEYKNTDNIPGWTQTTGAQNHGTCNNVASNDGSGIYMENWASKLSGDIKQTVSNIPNGKYFLKMSARTNPAVADLVKDYVYIKSGDAQSTGAILKNDNPSITITDPIEVKNGEVEIGLHIGSGCSWVVWNYVELYAYSVDDQTRSTTTGKYGTVCLPYNATVTGAKLYEAAVNDAKNEVVLTEVTGNIEAGKAYIYQATADEQTFAFVDDVDMVKDPATASLTGVFAQQTAPAGAYVLQTKDGEQKFFKVAEGSEPTINAYRAYLNVETASAAKALTISFGNPTAVDAVKALTEGDDAVIYDLTGKRLSKLQRGVNIVNGVKVIVK